MKSIKGLMFFLVAVSVLAACDKVTYSKTAGGMPYKLFRGKGVAPVRSGTIIKVNYTQKINDSVYFSTAGKLPIYIPVTAEVRPYDISELWLKLHKGDSLIATQMMDTFIKRSPTGIPPNFKNGDKIITTIAVIDIFPNDSLAKIDEEKTRQTFTKNEVDALAKELADKKINVQKTPAGAFVQIINPGTGDLITQGKYVSVMYRGTSASGKIFDTNMDTSFHHTDPLSFVVGTGAMIKGFDDAMFLLKPGAEAKVFIPSTLGFGASPAPGTGIKPYENVIFDIIVQSVKDSMPAQQRPLSPQGH